MSDVSVLCARAATGGAGGGGDQARLTPLHFNYSKRSSPSQRRPKERFHAANEDGRTAHESGVPGGSTNERGALVVGGRPLAARRSGRRRRAAIDWAGRPSPLLMVDTTGAWWCATGGRNRSRLQSASSRCILQRSPLGVAQPIPPGRSWPGPPSHSRRFARRRGPADGEPRPRR
jgi:hypothetical protein